ncbi:ParB/RepB/Spo0J family partition protein [Faecalicoccus pleomorphus]|uniref:ParB/RepB/Spo0J family partition protein n=1 Tax=Faecalicoccus pleomorphus TaxID=1323 RepID=UPI0019619771|nr:ParB/RepB/Spo0J family partition protein [Faecalicoccus pleomorphus]MBM6765750.1 ParB/RepB/Spo0J family partition protein [Faecalicoccus pleomorphus]MDM8291991.1 ParB/RepB/Spo0J family partition protein [Faecalicoccus pleomorphus]
MPRGKLENIGIPTLDEDVFVSDRKKAEDHAEKVIEIPIHKIEDFPNHPFQVRNDEEMMNLIDSVAKSGVIAPALVRPKEDGSYEMIAGHRRKYACLQNGLRTIPCIIRNLSDEEAVMIMVDTNLRQRQTILPSEKAFAYRMKLEAMKRQGARTDLTCAPVGHKSRDILAEQSEDSKSQIQRYIRLTYLIEPLLKLVDEGQIAMRPAVELSYLESHAQKMVLEEMEINVCSPSHDQTIRMRKAQEEGKLTDELISEIMQEEKPNQIEKIRLSSQRISRFFAPRTSVKEMENEIVKALEVYQRYKKRQREKQER